VYALVVKRNKQTTIDLALRLAHSWNRLETSLDASLSSIRGISFAEYRMLRALADAPSSSASRVDLARTIGRTPSGVTRALRPLEKIGVVRTQPSKRDARLALATLTKAGHEMVADASGVVSDSVSSMLRHVKSNSPTPADLLEALE
jgi:DNA-binding MarR family transcriptional regulator